MGLWEVLKTDGDEQNIANVKWLVEYAEGKLLLIRETFPDYTRHDQKHAENVISRIEELLGPSLGHLTPLEAAMLVLAAYFHDIGMVYHPDELAALIGEEDFKSFLDENPAAFVRAHQGTEIPRDVIVQYCRARHADRVAEHLFQLDPGRLAWDGVPVGEALATVCQSHMKPREELRSEQFPVAFLGSCDLRMCAILLRLADILDLDDTRSPTAVYDHLRLAGTGDRTRMISGAEWTKHMTSHGFRFPQERTPNFPLPFLASPRKPAVEHAIRKFLDSVDDELRGCRILLDFCDLRWRSLVLPGSIERTSIRGIGYRYGEYRFDLDREAVLRLFMGEKLYSNPYVFIRELLQNAIDACRLNSYLHDAAMSAMAVRVSAWEDGAGYFWLRVDDNGTGMDLGIVERYFLGVGRSYYRSDELQADILRRNKPQQKFVAISQFGVGVLSSFIVGDRVEVSTRRRLPDGKLAPALRLSLDSLDDFFVMQDPPMAPEPFPGRGGNEVGYRKTPGTSVAVRIDPTKTDVTLADLLGKARSSLFFPPVQVFINDVGQRDDRPERLDVPLLTSTRRFPLPTERKHEAGDAALWTTSDISLVALPLNLTASSPSPGIRGQLIAVRGEASGSGSLLPALSPELQQRLPGSLVRELDDCITERSISISEGTRPDQLDVTLHISCATPALKRLRDWARSQEEDRDIEWNIFRDIEVALDAIRIYGNSPPPTRLLVKSTIKKSAITGDTTSDMPAKEWLGHNGIRVSTNLPKEEFLFKDTLRLTQHGPFVIFGLVSLFDELRPDVSISRDVLLGLPFDIRSALHLAVRRAASRHLGSPEHEFAVRVMWRVLLNLRVDGLTSAQIESDPMASYWRAEKIFGFGKEEVRSIDELRVQAEAEPVALQLPRGTDFYKTISVAIAELELDIELGELPQSWDFSSYPVIVRSPARPVRPPGLSALPPFSAVRYRTPEILIAPGCPVNLRHPAGAWFAEHAAALITDYPALFAQFRRALSMIGSSRNVQEKDNRHIADGAADLLNATLDRIRRALPELADGISQEIYADQEYQLR